MDITEENNNEAIFTFLKETKDGKYSEIDINIIDTPRITALRDDYLVDEEYMALFSVTNQV